LFKELLQLIQLTALFDSLLQFLKLGDEGCIECGQSGTTSEKDIAEIREDFVVFVTMIIDTLMPSAKGARWREEKERPKEPREN